MTLIDFPQYVPTEEYERVVMRMVGALASVPGIRSIYQIGHVSTPGISDLDLLVVFAPGAHCLADPRAGLGAVGRYLFVHDLFGVSQGDFPEARSLSFFHNYRLLWGPEDATPDSSSLASGDEAVLKRQVALEYMLRIYLGLFVEQTYGLIKVRNLLLHGKALLYDCEFLNIGDGRFRDAAVRIVAHRNRWFTDPPSKQEITREAAELCRTLGEILPSLLKEHRFYLPQNCQIGGTLARHLIVRPGREFRVGHRGPKLPAAPAALFRKYVNLLHRLNHFNVSLPFACDDFPPVIHRAFELRRLLDAANRQHCPHFMSLAPGFNIL